MMTTDFEKNSLNYNNDYIISKLKMMMTNNDKNVIIINDAAP